MSNGNGNTTKRKLLDAGEIAAIARRLQTSAYASAMHEVRCEATADAVVLRGRVSSFYFKQLAQEVARKANDACRIINELEVEDRHCSAGKG